MSATKKVMTIGGATQDIFIRYKTPETAQFQGTAGKRSYLMLEEGKKIDINNLDYHTGGGATNSAVSFKRLGYDVQTCFKLGPDKAAEFVLQTMHHENIDTHLIMHDTEFQTGTSFIIPCPSGDRVVLAYRGANAQLDLSEIPFDEIAACDQLYITSLTGCSSDLLLPIAHFAKQKSIPVATNPGSSQLAVGNTMLRNALPYIDILILNSTEASILMRNFAHTIDRLKCLLYKDQPEVEKKLHLPRLLQGPILYKDVCFDLQDFFKEVIATGPRLVVVTNGAEGVYVATSDTIYFHSSIPTSTVSTLGAGDAFGSTFVASIMQNMSVEESLVRGILNSTSVISHLGAQTGLLSSKKLDELFKKTGIKQVHHFSVKD